MKYKLKIKGRRYTVEKHKGLNGRLVSASFYKRDDSATTDPVFITDSKNR